MAKMLYKKGSTYKIREGMVDHKVFEEEEITQAIKDGWFEDPRDCFVEKNYLEDNTRALLEVEAKELGVSFNARTSDEVLKERILEAK